MRKNEILVTGGAGYIGSQTCKHLAIKGFTPVSIDNLSTGFKHNVKWGPLYVLDLRDKDRLKSIFDQHKFIAIIHFAANASVFESMQFPIDYFDNNVISTFNLINVASNFGLNRIIFSSSCATYGIGQSGKISEETNQNPINTYGDTKLMCENFLRRLDKLGKLQYVILRYFNAAGADSDLQLGEEHLPEPHVIPNLIEAAFLNKIFSVYGNNYETVDGSAVRDFVHVLDLADAHVKAVEYLLNGGSSLELNIGSGRGTSVLQLIDKFQSMGYKISHQILDQRVGDPGELVADIIKAKEILGWSPSHSSIEEIIQTALAWQQFRMTRQ